MKLNNKGFAITSVLYGLLILFVSLVGTYLTILVSKMNRLSNISEDINDYYALNKEVYKSPTVYGEQINLPFTAQYTGKYKFIVNFDGDTLNCYSYIAKGTEINSNFKGLVCNKNYNTEITSIFLIEILTNGDDTSE